LAISPQTARTKLIESQRQAIQDAEKSIDNALAAGGRDFVIPSLPPAALGELKGRYERAGWVVSLKSGLRDGSYWHFAEAGYIDREREI
jgi:hypothetical protein